MSDYSQPVAADDPEWVADIWPLLDTPAKLLIFPLLKGEARRTALSASKGIIDEREFNKQVEEYAQSTLIRRAANREADRIEAERNGAEDSWAAQNIADLFDTDQQEPEIGAFMSEGGDSSTGGVFYRGKVNEVHGPSESGKTMWVLAVAVQEIRAERHVVMVDYEDDGRAIVNRLRYVFDLEREQIEKYFHYFRPDVPFTQTGLDNITGIGDVSMCIIDAVTESMAVSGLDGRNENEVATWYNDFPKKLASSGMGVVLIDHTPQGDSNRQIGSQHKKSAVDGVSYTAEPVYPFVKGQLGHLRIRVAKDKIGSIRTAALPQGEGKQYWRGDFKIDGRPTAVGERVLVTGVTALGQANTGKAHDVKNITLPSPSEAIILTILAESGEWMSAQAIMAWHNERLPEKDPGRLSRTAPRKRAVGLIKKGLAERRDSGASVLYRISQDGHHSINTYMSSLDAADQEAIDLGFTEDSEPTVNPTGEPGEPT